MMKNLIYITDPILLSSESTLQVRCIMGIVYLMYYIILYDLKIK